MSTTLNRQIRNTSLQGAFNLGGQKISGGLIDDAVAFSDPADATKRARIDAGNVAAGQTRVINMPDRDIDLGASWEVFQTVYSSAQASWSKTDAGVYRHIRIFGFLRPATDNVAFYLRTSTDAGVSYAQGASDYNFQTISARSTTLAGADGNAAQITLGSTVGNAAGEGVEFDILITDFNQAVQCKAQAQTTEIDLNGAPTLRQIFGRRLDSTARNALQIRFGSGSNIASGSLTFMGLR